MEFLSYLVKLLMEHHAEIKVGRDEKQLSIYEALVLPKIFLS